MAQTSLNIPIDEEIRDQFHSICQELGLSMGTAFTVFARAFVRADGFPFDVNLTSPNAQTLTAIDDVNNGRNLSGPYHSIAELKEALNA